MRKRGPSSFRVLLAAILVALVVDAAGGASAADAKCALVPSERDRSVKVLRCGDDLVVQAAGGARYRVLYRAGRKEPVGVRLDDGALLIEFHPSAEHSDFQILTPLAIAAVRGTKWAMEVAKSKTSAFVVSGAVAVTSRRLNEYVILTAGQGVDISEGDTTLTQKQWGEARVRALLSRFGE